MSRLEDYEHENTWKNVLIIGSDSQIGLELFDYLQQKNLSVYGTTRRLENVKDTVFYLDLENPIFEQFDREFDTVIMCASITSIKYCQENYSDCERINVSNSIKIINHFRIKGSFIIYLSSVDVFNGEIPFQKYTDDPSPISNYGKFKLKVENYLTESAPKSSAIIRLTKVLSKNTPIVKLWNKNADENEEIITYSDKYISPIEIYIVLDAIHLVLTQQSYGLYQLGGDKEISYTDFAQMIFVNKDVKITSRKENVIYKHNSLVTHLPSKEFQYNEMMTNRRITMGLMSGDAYTGDAKRLTFTLSRYKFVSKMFSGFDRVLEVGCADAFGTPIVANEVNELVASDFDLMFIKDAQKNHPYKDRISFIFHDMVSRPLDGIFEGIFSLDVLEHIDKNNENMFMKNIIQNLSYNGTCIIGMPSIESQIYASEISKKGHVNCKSGAELKDFCSKFFERVFIFSMNDEVVHTGFQPMSQYLLALCCFPKKQ